MNSPCCCGLTPGGLLPGGLLPGWGALKSLIPLLTFCSNRCQPCNNVAVNKSNLSGYDTLVALANPITCSNSAACCSCVPAVVHCKNGSCAY